MPESRKQVGEPLGLIDDHMPRVLLEEPLDVGLQERQVGRTLQVESSPRRPQGPHESALAALPGAKHEHHRKITQQPFQAFPGGPGDVFHALHF
jgi:hypothetical protein